MSSFDLVSQLQTALTATLDAEKKKEKEAERKLERSQAIAAALVERTKRNKPFAITLKEDARNYRPSPELVTAVNVALSQGRPLLLTGEPGSGKTQAVYWIALLFGLEDQVLEYQVRSESRAKELRYDFDAVSWFRQSQLAALNKDPNPVLKSTHIKPGVLGTAFGWELAADRPFVVLIDEIDKAPRDFPNDLLLELSQMRFAVEEWETEKKIGPPAQRPFIVITSNSERRLPDPFLRRCVVHDIKLDEKTVTEIFVAKLMGFGVENAALGQTAARFWTELSALNLSRKPTIAELWQGLALETTKGEITNEQITAMIAERNFNKLNVISTLFTPQDLDKIGKQPKTQKN